MKVAVIGCGTIANSAHIPAYLKNPEAEIAYLCDILLERAEAAVQTCGRNAVAITDYRDALRDPAVEAVSVCVPNNMHARITMDALAAGKHVLCEKPAARTFDEALEMQKAQHASGKVLCIGVVNRFNDNVNLIREYIREGRLGDVFHVYVSFRSHRSIPGLGGAFTTRAIAGGGALIDWGVHYLDLVLYCCGEPKVLTASGEVFCRLGRDIKNYTYLSMWANRTKAADGVYDVDDSCAGLLRTTGPVISFHGAWAQNIGESETYIDFMGDKGGIRLNYCGNFVYYTAQDGGLVKREIQLPESDFYCAEIDSFVHSVKTRVPNQAHIDRTIEASKILDAIYRSSESHREVEV